MEQHAHVWFATALLAVILVLGQFFVAGVIQDNSVSQSDIELAIQAGFDSLVIPEPASASDIASEIDIPEVQVDARVNDLWEDLYASEIAVLEGNATDDATLELEDDSFEFLDDWFTENVEDFEEITDVDYEEVEAQWLQLSLEDEQDAIALVTFELEVEYELSEGPVQDYKMDLVVEAMVSYDEGDFSEEDVELVVV